MGRAEQKERTRGRIVDAAVEAFAEQGYEAAGTRDIAARAGVTQGLIAYHFESKEALWRAAASRIFEDFVISVPDLPSSPDDVTVEQARDAIKQFVRFSAAHPEVVHIMNEVGKTGGERMHWMVQNHLAPVYELVRLVLPGLTRLGPGEDLEVHLYYALIGAASMVFALAPECVAMTSVDPTTSAFVERHAELVARMLLPDRS